LEEDVMCLAANNKDVLTGSANCFPYWLESLPLVEVGKELNGAVIKQDTFLWLRQSMATCTGSGNVALTGTTDCALVNTGRSGACSTSQINRLALMQDVGATCVPTLTWESASA